ncbi:hypothetical protein EIP91_010264 [Steccherinum ochraceum]|uniref:Uncharacterized protein n=1 Tax=Steccherinum ochraceum TaxID=92696 RepID=A0A4R0RSW0_9APHY|nr:hypothetical protein EIP91_010264 [Steccherinum ochraceum]
MAPTIYVSTDMRVFQPPPMASQSRPGSSQGWLSPTITPTTAEQLVSCSQSQQSPSSATISSASPLTPTSPRPLPRVPTPSLTRKHRPLPSVPSEPNTPLTPTQHGIRPLPLPRPTPTQSPSSTPSHSPSSSSSSLSFLPPTPPSERPRFTPTLTLPIPNVSVQVSSSDSSRLDGISPIVFASGQSFGVWPTSESDEDTDHEDFSNDSFDSSTYGYEPRMTASLPALSDPDGETLSKSASADWEHTGGPKVAMDRLHLPEHRVSRRKSGDKEHRKWLREKKGKRWIEDDYSRVLDSLRKL